MQIPLASVHGPVAKTFSSGITQQEDISALYKLLFEGVVCHKLCQTNNSKNFNISGKLIGGNLAIICSLLGTSYVPDFRDTILFIEDIGEEAFRIERYLWQLFYSGIFFQIKAIIWGRFSDIKNEKGLENPLYETLKSLANNIPVFRTTVFGHDGLNMPFVTGINAEIISDGGIITLKQNF